MHGFLMMLNYPQLQQKCEQKRPDGGPELNMTDIGFLYA